MRRIHLFEFHDLPWYPSVWRNMLTDVLNIFAVAFKPYRPIAPKLKAALEALQCRRIVDLGSGAGGPLLSILDELGQVDGRSIECTLTDKYPTIALFRHQAATHAGRVSFYEEAVDATAVPEELQGFRTMFTSFHHFNVDAAHAILHDAVSKRQGIGVFEYTERAFWFWGPALLFGWAFVWLTTPFMRPFRWHRLLWNYVIPLWFLFGLWDGVVSCFRTYSPRELRELTADLGGGYSWEIGRVRSIGACRITYLIGVPEPTVT